MHALFYITSLTYRKKVLSMDLIQAAKNLGFSDAAIMNTKDLVFKPEYRKFCEENQ